MKEKNVDTGERYRVNYEGDNCYITVTEYSMDISMVSHDVKDRTLTGLGIIDSLVTLLLEEEVEPERIAAVVWANSRRKLDLADVVASLLVGDMGVIKW